MTNRVVLASHNQGKLKELSALLAPLDMRIESLPAHSAAPPEDAATFVENALIKARYASQLTGLPAIADDSGLCVEVLHGAPGIRSARFAGPNADDVANNHALLAALGERSMQLPRAWFHCCMVYLHHPADPAPIITVANWFGHILHAPRGSSGFGYDPLFWLPELGKSSAELTPSEKNRLSHRGQASRALLEQLAARSAA